MKLLIKLFFLSFFFTGSLFSQTTYFPKESSWEVKEPKDFKIDAAKLNEAIKFANENEYSGSKDLRIAILDGFRKEPFHEITGPTKKRGGPTGIILKDGYIIAKWGDPERVDMTFSVTKSFLSTTALLALKKGLIDNFDDPVNKYVWDGTFEGKHNAEIT